MDTPPLFTQPVGRVPAAFPPLPLDPGFLQLVSDELQDAALPTDGFDTVFDELVAIVDALDTALGLLNPTLDETFAEALTIDAQPVSDTVDLFTASLVPSDSAVNDLGALLAGVAAPAPSVRGGGAAGTVYTAAVTLSFSNGGFSPEVCLKV